MKKSESEPSRRPPDDWRPKCYRHGEPTPKMPTILEMHFPRGKLPGEGFRCPTCGEEALLAEEVARLQKEAHRLGLYGLEDAQLRKLLRTGNSIAVSLDPNLIRQVLGDRKPGDAVRVGREGRRIVIEPAEAP